jgi:hypothetical protein
METKPWEDYEPAPAPASAPVPQFEIRGTAADEEKLQPSLLKRAIATLGDKETWRPALNTVLDAPTALTTGAAKFGSSLIAPVDLARDYFADQPMGTAHKERVASIEDYGRSMARDPESLGYRATEVIPEMLGTGPAIAKAGATLAPKALGRLAPATGDILANTGYEASKAAAEGRDVGQASKWGAAGSAAGRAVGAVVGGVKSALPRAQQLFLERGGVPTTGQLLGGIAKTAESSLGNFPLLGRISGAKSVLEDASRTFSTADVNRALEPIGARTAESGQKAVVEAVNIANEGYARVIPQTKIKTSDARRAVSDAISTVIGGRDPTSAVRRAKAARIIATEAGELTRVGTFPTGREVKNVDTRLGELEQDYAQRDPQIARAIRQAKQNIREALTPVTGAPNSVTTELQNLNKTRAQLYSLEDAMVRSAGKTGHFNATQSFQARSAGGRPPTDDEMNYFIRAQDEQKGGGFIPTGLGLTASIPLGTVLRGVNARPVRRAIGQGLAGGIPEGNIRRFIQSQEFAQALGQAGRKISEQE